MKKSILESIKQLFLIVFSVFLGIFLSERIEERKNKKEAALLLSKIISEVTNNKKLLEDWVPYHREIVNRLDSLNENEAFIMNFIEDESTLFSEILTRGNMMSDMPSKEAWDIAKSHPLIVHFDYDELLILSKVYNQQAVTYASVPKIIELFLSGDFNSKEKASTNLQAFTNQMREVVSREMQLMNYLKEAEKILGLKNN